MFDKANLGDNLMKFGSSLASMGIMYGIAKESMRGCGCNSVFGGGGYGGYGMGMGMGMGMPGMMGMTNPMFGMGGMGMPGMMGMNMGNPMFAMGGMGMPYGMGAANPFMMNNGSNQFDPMAAMYNNQPTYNQQPAKQTLGKLNAARAEKVSRDQDITKGKELENATQDMTDENGKSISGVGYSFVSDDWLNLADKPNRTASEDTQLSTGYSQSVVELAKSYLMRMDTDSGNKDGQITMAEYTQYNLYHGLPDDINPDDKSDAKVQEAVKRSGTAFNKLDQNQDGVVDWKEMGAMIHSADKGAVKGKKDFGKQDGKITSDDLDKFSQQLVDDKSDAADYKLREGYQSLFSNNQE